MFPNPFFVKCENTPNHNCRGSAGCGAEVHLEEGRITRLTPIQNHPYSVLCTRGLKAPEIVYSPDRLLYPQRRVGARGEGKFERISWDEAYTTIVDGLQRIADNHGPEAAGISTGRGNFEYGLNEMFAPAGTAESSANAVQLSTQSPQLRYCTPLTGLISARWM